MKNLKIEATVLISGAIFMALEIIGGRLLTPYFGDTVYIWGSIIGIFMISLAVGYHLGGRLADKKPKEHILSLIIFIAGIFTLIIPFTYKNIINIFNILPASFAPLAASLTIFIIPSVLLGMVSPFAIKLKARSLKKIGKLSGNLYSIGTIGSVIGAFASTFVIIPLFPLKTVFISLAIILLLLPLLIFKKNFKIVLPAVLIIIVILWIFPAQAEQLQENILFNEESLYGLVTVYQTTTERGTVRSLSLNGGVMTEMDMDDMTKTVEGWKYFDCFEIPFTMNSEIHNVLTLGLGGGSIQKNIHRKYDIDLDAVDINEKIVEVAKDYFYVKESETFRIYVDDGRMFLKNTDKKYDLIAVDVVHHDPEQGYKLPFHLATQEFFKLAKQHLNPDGIIVMNFISDPDSDFLRSEYKTISSVFNDVLAFSCDTMVLIASDTTYDIEELNDLDRYQEIELSENNTIFNDEYFPVNIFSEITFID